MLEFTDEFTRCATCGDEFYSRDQSLASSRAAARALREHERLLPPDRIRAIRQSYGLTQAEFERALRLGLKTVVRWESGTVRQSGIANSLLVAIDGHPDAFRAVAAANGFEWRPPERHFIVRDEQAFGLGVKTYYARGATFNCDVVNVVASASTGTELLRRLQRRLRTFKAVPETVEAE